MTAYYKGLIAETNARDEAYRVAKRLRDETTFCDHGKNDRARRSWKRKI